MKQFDIVTVFKKEGIHAIMNLEQINEHAFCGDGLEITSGFSYLPESFMDAGSKLTKFLCCLLKANSTLFYQVYYYNFSW
jgi:hypothetical protein